MNWFDRSNIHNIEFIQYYQNAPQLLHVSRYIDALHMCVKFKKIKLQKSIFN
jgi:hypothetical protein